MFCRIRVCVAFTSEIFTFAFISHAMCRYSTSIITPLFKIHRIYMLRESGKYCGRSFCSCSYDKRPSVESRVPSKRRPTLLLLLLQVMAAPTSLCDLTEFIHTAPTERRVELGWVEGLDCTAVLYIYALLSLQSCVAAPPAACCCRAVCCMLCCQNVPQQPENKMPRSLLPNNIMIIMRQPLGKYNYGGLY